MEKIKHCYDFFDRTMAEQGMLDLTEGMYSGIPETPYDQAQKSQINWLLDRAKCGHHSRILDIGCGNGTLLEAAQKRGAAAVGVTISPAQVGRCRSRGLQVELRDYRKIGDQWNGKFDAIVANGSIEHFVQVSDYLEGRSDAIYREMFATCRRLIDPASSSRRLVTTIIHRHKHSPMPDFGNLHRGPLAFRWGSAGFHYALLQRGFGGFYPEIGQMERCADRLFNLVEVVDGTQDYRLTSETCFRLLKKAFFSWRSASRLWKRLAGFMLRHPFQGAVLITCLFLAESWQWQFRGPNPPTRLLRQTWDYV